MIKVQGSPPTVAEVVGRTARRLRGDRKVELVARAAQSAGLNWGTGRIADLEAGRVSPTLPTLLQLCVAFSDLLDRPVRLAGLLQGDGQVTLSAGATVELEELRAALLGEPIGLKPIRPMAPAGMALDDEEIADLRSHVRERIAADPRRGFGLLLHPRVQRVEQTMLEADSRMAHSVGLELLQAARVMEALWGRSFTAERDHRAGPDANPQKRGRISRELKAELKKAISRGDD